MSRSNHKILYTAFGSIVLYTGIAYTIDYFLNIQKPSFIKTNGKVDKNKQLLYTLLISSLLFVIVFAIIYQIFV